MSFRYEVNTVGGSPDSYSGNAVVFEGVEEAKAAARELASRWLAVVKWRVVETDDAVTYRFYFKGDQAVPLSEDQRALVALRRE